MKKGRHASIGAMLRIALIVLVLALIGAGLGVYSLTRAPTTIPKEGLLVAVRPGASTKTIADEASRAGAVRSATVFRVLARALGKEAELKSGSYRVMPGMGSLSVLELIVSGKQALVRVTIPEGYTLRQTAVLLDRLKIAPADSFIAAARDESLISSLGIQASSLEGYLYPDTYFFPNDYPAPDLIRTMVGAFRSKLAEAIPESATMEPKALQDKLILASIVEREYRIPEEAPLMASVFANRLKIKMALQSCATVVYVMTEIQGKPHPERIFDRDLAIKDPHNTYAQRGLPPGPICSPGLTALRSAFRPASSSFLYFRLVDANAGRHHFSVSLEEHRSAADLIIKKVGG